jgi:hypothetical protein
LKVVERNFQHGIEGYSDEKVYRLLGGGLPVALSCVS